jgi:hypothetical protein
MAGGVKHRRNFRITLGNELPASEDDRRPLAQASGELKYETPRLREATYDTEDVYEIMDTFAIVSNVERQMQVPVEIVTQSTHPGIDSFTRDEDELASKIQYTIARTHAVNMDRDSPIEDQYHTREAALTAFGVIRRGEQERLMSDFRWATRKPP